jgi:hypothetical protein
MDASTRETSYPDGHAPPQLYHHDFPSALNVSLYGEYDPSPQGGEMGVGAVSPLPIAAFP